MARETLLKIQEAESKAQALLSDARASADSIIKNSEEELTQEFSQLSEQAEKQALDEKEAAVKTAKLLSEDFSKQTQELCNALKKEMLLKKASAVDLVIGMLLD